MPQESKKPEKLKKVFFVLFIAFSVITLLLFGSEPVYLFSLDPEVADVRDAGQLTYQIREAFQIQGEPLTANVTVEVKNPNEWVIKDADTQYLIRNERQRLNVYKPAMGNVFARISSALGGPSDLPEPSEKIGNTALIGSVIASVSSLIGFITTTMITWRKEKREASLAEVQRKKLETELEKSRLELEELKKSKAKKRKK